ncbi:MAG: hypothetical protein DRQ88_13005 [Epsilonproteobacteria bacterium]|nr:MAG: hypothetical protein DRQ88_13005 [Campylobacterota bacterium]
MAKGKQGCLDGILEDWILDFWDSEEDIVIRVKGMIFRSALIEDETFMITSKVLDLDMESKVVDTSTGVYRLGRPDKEFLKKAKWLRSYMK